MRRVLPIAGRLALAAVFLYAAYAKLKDPWVLFAMTIDGMHILPNAAGTFVARTLPWFELILGIVLLAGVKMRYATSISSTLLVSFLIVVTTLYVRGFQGDCGCFGPGEQLGPRTLARDGALVALSIWVTWGAFRKRSPL